MPDINKPMPTVAITNGTQTIRLVSAARFRYERSYHLRLVSFTAKNEEFDEHDCPQ